MAYRNPSEKPNPENLLVRYPVRNGATLKLAFHCFYVKPKPGHDPHYHDYKNWPAPNYHPGPICQTPPPRDVPRFFTHGDMRLDHPEDLEDIHLLDEGYTEAAVVFEDAERSAYVTTEAWIDEDEDNIVRIHVNTALPNFSDEAIEMPFTVFVKKIETDLTTRVTQDAVAHSIMLVLPGHPYPTS